MIKIEPLLLFNGQCEQAIELYTKAFGAKLIYLGRYGKANPQDVEKETGIPFDKVDKSLVYHAQIKIGRQVLLMADDIRGGEYGQRGNVHLVASLDTAEAVEAAYAALSDGATIVDPLHKTAYCSCCGTLVDKFGMYWDIMAAK